MIPCQSDEMDEDHARQALRGAVIRFVILLKHNTISANRKKPGPIAYFPAFFPTVGRVLPQRREGKAARTEMKMILTKRKEIKKTQNNSTRELSPPFSSCVIVFPFFVCQRPHFVFQAG